MSAEARSSRATTLIIGLVLLIVAAVTVWRWAQAPEADEPVVIDASGPDLSAVGALADASDLVVVGTLGDPSPGRAITDPRDPTAGILTELFPVEVQRVIQGDAPRAVVVEQEATLLDGTPIAVEGRAPARAGTQGVFFLVRGTGADAQYHAFADPGLRVEVVGERIVADGDDPVDRALDGLPLDALADLLARS